MLINCSQPLMRRATLPYISLVTTLILGVGVMCAEAGATSVANVSAAVAKGSAHSKDSSQSNTSIPSKGPGESIPDDSVYVFESPVPLAGPLSRGISDPTSFLIRLMISGNGYGLGFGYDYQVSANWSVFADFALSGARNTSELELQDPYTFIVYVPNKVNRLFILPLCLGTRYNIPKEYVADNISPYLSLGAGASAVVRAPYDPVNGDLFSSLGYADTYSRPAGFVGAGMIIESSEKSYATIDARYYIIPFGGEGLESVRGKPMKDFNGLFVSVAIGIR